MNHHPFGGIQGLQAIDDVPEPTERALRDVADSSETG